MTETLYDEGRVIGECSLVQSMHATQRATHPTGIEKLDRLGVTQAGMGSKLPRLRSGSRQPAQTPAKHLNFDFVRLTPHFAQDDKSVFLRSPFVSLCPW
jgi:hypothetical protein